MSLMDQLNKLFIGLMAVGITGLLGCGPSGSSSGGTGPQVYTYNTANDVETAMTNFSVSCEGACPENAGALIIKDGTQLFSCSFSLVDSQTVLTSRHCIPDSMASVGASCDGSVQAIFKNDSGSSDIYGCDKVVSFSQEWQRSSSTQRDFVFLKLKKATTRKPLKIDPSGVQDKEVLTALTATPDLGASHPTSILVKKSCTVHMNSLVDSDFTNGHKPVVVFKDCPVVEGNSGSAMIAANGKIKVVTQALVRNLSSSLDQSQDIQTKLLRALGQGQFALGTNTECMQEEDLHLTPAADGCDTNKDKYSIAQAINEDEMKKKLLALQAQLNSTVDVFQFQVKAVNSDASVAKTTGVLMSVSFEPACIQGSANGIPWMSRYQNKGMERFINKYQKEAVLNYESPAVQYIVDMNEDVRVVMKTQITYIPTQLNLPLRELAENPSAEVPVTGASAVPLMYSTVNVPALYKLKLCGATPH